jgi:hypothetical protein
MKNKIYMIVIAVCIVLAIVIFVTFRSQGPAGVRQLRRGEMIWVKCNNPDCGATYEIDKKDYFLELERKATENPAAAMSGNEAITCKECGQESCFRAVKCEKCGNIFFYGRSATYADKCPECGYSKTEAERKARRENR